MRTQRLERVADAGDRVAVVDQQRGAALLHDPAAEFEHEAMACWVHLQHVAVARGAPDVGLGLGRHVEGESARVVEPNHALPPLIVDADKLAHRQGVEKLVADHDGRTRGRLLQGLRPGDRYAGVEKEFVLHRSQGRARLDEPDV